jgi:hypothetical protein
LPTLTDAATIETFYCDNLGRHEGVTLFVDSDCFSDFVSRERLILSHTLVTVSGKQRLIVCNHIKTSFAAGPMTLHQHGSDRSTPNRSNLMPMLIEHIDAIARKKQRDVLFVTFHPPKSADIDEWDGPFHDWEQDSMRETVCQWLTDHQINWQLCGEIASENMMRSYGGQIYLDVPYDDNDPLYVLVRDYLEHPDGRMRFETVSFWYLPLEKAMENAHHDEPGFWEKWAESF